MNRGYASGLAANRGPTTGLAANRAPMTGRAAGAPAGGGFRSSFQSSFSAPAPSAKQMQPAAPMPGTTQPPMATPAPMDFSLPEPPPVDFSNMFGAQPLPAPGQQSFNQPPPNPFGPAPLPFGGFRAEGGPVMPGQAYMVGERGPEMIVPQMPGMVLPNQSLTGRASAQDGAVRSGPLSTRGATPVGSGRGMTPERRLEIAARRGDQRANLALFNAEQWGRGGRGPARALPPPMPMGRAPQAMTRPMPDFPPRSPAQQPQAPEPMAAPQFDLSNMLPPMAPGGAMAPLPPSTLMGGSGVPAGPRFSEVSVGGMNLIVDNDTDKQVAAYKPEPNRPPPTFEMRRDATGAFRQFYDGKPIAGEPTYSGQVVPGSYVRRETQGQPAPVQYTPNLPQPTERVTVDAEGNQTRTFTQPRGATPAPAPGPADGAAPIERTTSSGVKVQVSMPDQAGRMTGQMPNEAYANPLTLEQSLEAARAEYLATGNDAALRKHFQQFPSQAVQLNRQEGQVWNQIGQNVGQMATNANLRGRQIEERNAYIDRFSGSPLTQGAIAEEYARNFPQGMTEINRAPLRPNFDLLTQADRLNRQAEQAAGRAAPPAMLPLGPTEPVMPRTRADTNPGGVYDRLMRMNLPTPRVTTRPV
jgi:hypothetical protein